MYNNPNFISQVNILGEPLNQEINTINPKRKNRNVYLESAIDHEEYLNSHNINKVGPAPIRTEAFTAQIQNGVIYETLKPIYLLMRAMGIFPVANTDVGVFKMTPSIFGYSVGVFLVVLSYVAYIQWDSVQIVKSQEGRFEEAVIDYLFTVYLVPILMNPLVWYEGRKLAKVVTDWVIYERLYSKVVKRKMSIFLGNKPLIIAVVLPLISCIAMVITHLTMTHFSIVHVIPYCYINTLIYLIGGFWFIQCDVVGKVATIVADDFQASLRNMGPSSHVADYRAMWMLLSRIICDVGNASGCTLTFLCLYLFLITTLTIYGLLSQLQAGFSSKDIGLTVNAALATAILFFICDEAHYASNCVRVQFQKKLLLVELTWMNDDVQQEINMFLRASEMSSTDMSLVGFFDVNRNLFKSLLATMVTYLVVLLQFQISIPEDGGTDINTTVVTRTTTQTPK